MNKITWKDNAEQFAALDRQEGWTFARLVACSVEKGKGHGGDRSKPTAVGLNEKVSAGVFATEALTSDKRVLRYWDAWESAAKEGLCTPSADLAPGDVESIAQPPHDTWSTHYRSIKGVGDDDSLSSKAADITRNKKALADAIKADPKTRDAAIAAAIESDRGAVNEAMIQESRKKFEAAKAKAAEQKAARDQRRRDGTMSDEEKEREFARTSGPLDGMIGDMEFSLLVSRANVLLPKMASQLAGKSLDPDDLDILVTGLDEIQAGIDLVRGTLTNTGMGLDDALSAILGE